MEGTQQPISPPSQGKGVTPPKDLVHDVSFEAETLAFEEKAFAALAYVWVMFLVPLILKRDNKFIVFHLRQGISLFIAEVLAAVLLWVLGVIVLAVAPLLGFGLMQWLNRIVFLFFVILSLFAIYQTFRGKEWKMPVLHKFAQLIKI